MNIEELIVEIAGCCVSKNDNLALRPVKSHYYVLSFAQILNFGDYNLLITFEIVSSCLFCTHS